MKLSCLWIQKIKKAAVINSGLNFVGGGEGGIRTRVFALKSLVLEAFKTG